MTAHEWEHGYSEEHPVWFDDVEDEDDDLDDDEFGDDDDEENDDEEDENAEDPDTWQVRRG
jgi:hypothetical protein